MKKIGIIIIISIFTISLFCFSACNDLALETGDAYKKPTLDVPNSSIDPSQSIVDWAIIPDAADTAAMTALAKRMYDNANHLDQMLDYRQAKVFCEVSTKALFITITPHQYVYDIKNGEELYHCEAQTVVDPYCNIQYGTLQSNKMVGFRMKKDVNVENGVITADLDSAESMGTLELPIFHKDQSHEFTKTSFIIDETTMQNVVISHTESEEGNYYVVEFDVDISKPETVAGPMAGLKAAVPDAQYTSVHEYMEIWDSGYYRFFRSLDKWTGTKGVKVNAVIDYNTYYSYDRNDCIIADYFGIEKLKAEIAK